MTTPVKNGGALGTMHRILIGAAILVGIVFAGYSAKRYSAWGETSALVLAILSAAAAVALGFYLRCFIHKSRR